MKRGNCYATAEALFHFLGGKAAGYTPMVMRHEGDTHWFLKHESGLVLDPLSRSDLFDSPPDYSTARGCGFLTKKPSKKARVLMQAMTWQAAA